MKKVFISMLAFALIITLFIPSSLKASAEETSDLSNFKVVSGSEFVKDVKIDTENLEKDVNKAFDEYGLTPINLETEIPKGTEVINFDNIEDFHKFMISTNEPIKIDTKIPEKSLFAPMAAAASPVKEFKTSQNSGFGNINLHVRVTKNSSGKLTVNKTWTSHTGVTLGIDWQQTYAYSNLNSAKTGGTSYGGGTKSWVIFVSGIGTIRKQNVDLTLSFNNKF